MSEENKSEKKPEVDLSALENLEFSTAWSPSTNYTKFERGDKSNFKKRPFNGNREERPFKKREFGEKREFANGDRPRRTFDKRDGDNKEGRDNGGFRGKGGFKGKPAFRKGPPAPFNFTMEALFYPEDGPFAKLSDVMKHLKRTYQLFDIAELVIEKAERFIILAKNLPGEDGKVQPLYCAQPQNLPFDDEESAKRAAVDHYIGEMFETVEIEVEAPKGSFQVVHKTRLTGDLLGAPNWHGYGAHVRAYHAQKFPNMPYEKFASTIESVRDEEQLAAWLEQMKKRTAYKLKDGEQTFETRAEAAAYVLEQKGAELVKSYEQVRMHGSDIALLPANSRIRRNLEAAWAKQKKFPIITANNLRGRLRRSGFTIYKRGSKGFAFVSAVKRKFLMEGETLSEKPQKIYDFLCANQGMKAGDLPFAFLGLKAPKGVSKAAPLADEHKKQDEGEEVSAPLEIVENAPAEMSAEDVKNLKEVSNDLLWLISEGYVVEYADSSLQANPRLPRPKEKTSKTIASDAESVMLGVEDEPIVAKQEEAKAEEESSDEDADPCVPYGSECPHSHVVVSTDEVPCEVPAPKAKKTAKAKKAGAPKAKKADKTAPETDAVDTAANAGTSESIEATSAEEVDKDDCQPYGSECPKASSIVSAEEGTTSCDTGAKADEAKTPEKPTDE